MKTFHKFAMMAVAILATLSLASCSNDDDDEPSPGQSTHNAKVASMGNFYFYYDENNNLTKMIAFGNYMHLSYDPLSIQWFGMNDIELRANEKGYVTYARSAGNQIHTDFTYNRDGYLTRIVNTYEDRELTIEHAFTWENGLLTQWTRETPSSPSQIDTTITFTYGNDPNVNGIWQFYFCNNHMNILKECGEHWLATGLLGKAPSKLLKSAHVVENDPFTGPKDYSFEYTFDSRGYLLTENNVEYTYCE